MLGNGAWTGVRLDDVLRELMPQLKDMSRDQIAGLHVSFKGLDGYYTSVPLGLVLDSKSDCMLAFKMNGEELTPDHGFPVRALLPGIAGARNVKWLSDVSVIKTSDRDSPWTVHFYRDCPPGSERSPVNELPMNSVILSPEPGAWLDARAQWLEVQGVAYPGGTQRRITKVELSTDRGQTWQEARCLFSELPRDDSKGPPKSWIRFEATVSLPPAGTGAMGSGRSAGAPLTEVWCRAFDDTGKVQPQTSPPHGGYKFNGYHRVPIVRSLNSPPRAKAG
eukprot:TRINITY_DN94375_c0_g1_i1.p1 TRINITY_DN94375_c0_g1~~TRINITY_DN94375_c0_g1_i1.p1  ORF type:complete len:286 (-),score=41.93 TRINITY_DN94375_c0_g1_i1:38-871(-)